VDAAAGVLAQFGGVMLAFAFIATIGIQGVITVFLRDAFGIDIFANGTWLYELPGLILPYVYFQIPSWSSRSSRTLRAEAAVGRGEPHPRRRARDFWTHIGVPVLAPSFTASLLLLFANAFSSYATAAALASQGRRSSPCRSARRSRARPCSGGRTSPVRSPSA
jgi:putative spermidine/putrescine transport system permease protein